MNEKIELLAKKIQAETLARFVASNKRLGYSSDEPSILSLHGKSAIITSVKPGLKYTKIDVGSSGKYMIDNSTGEIFGIKAYGVINKKHAYGNLETIDNYLWGDYTAERIR